MNMSQGTPVIPGLVPRIPMRTQQTKRLQSPRWLAISVWAFFVSVWVALGVLLVVSPGVVDDLWVWIGDQPTIAQIAIWVAFLPVTIALAVLQTDWADWVRIGVLILCVIWTTLGFYPNRISSKNQARRLQ